MHITTMRACRATATAALLLAALPGGAVPQVVSDAACRVNAAGVADFATCDDGKAPTPVGADPPGAQFTAPAANKNKETKPASVTAVRKALQIDRAGGGTGGKGNLDRVALDEKRK